MTEITPQNILRHELIGMNVRVTRAKNPTIKGARGTVINETRNMLTLVDGGKRRMIPKSVATFRFKLPNGVLVDVDGERLIASPENRLKTRVRRW